MKGRATASRRAVFRGRNSRQSEDALALPPVDSGERPRIDRGVTEELCDDTSTIEQSDTSTSEVQNNSEAKSRALRHQHNKPLQFNNFKPGRFLKPYPFNGDTYSSLDLSVIKAFIIFYNFSLTTYT